MNFQWNISFICRLHSNRCMSAYIPWCACWVLHVWTWTCMQQGVILFPALIELYYEHKLWVSVRWCQSTGMYNTNDHHSNNLNFYIFEVITIFIIVILSSTEIVIPVWRHLVGYSVISIGVEHELEGIYSTGQSPLGFFWTTISSTPIRGPPNCSYYFDTSAKVTTVSTRHRRLLNAPLSTVRNLLESFLKRPFCPFSASPVIPSSREADWYI